MASNSKDMRFVKHLGEFITSLSAAEIQALKDGLAELQVVPIGKRSRNRHSKDPKRSGETLNTVLQYLHQAHSRETGFAKLDREVNTKAALVALARLADLPVQRKDTVEDLRQRIVEATIGYRLRSQAVKGAGGT